MHDHPFKRAVGTIVIITAPYKFWEKNGRPMLSGMLFTFLNPETLNGKRGRYFGGGTVGSRAGKAEPAKP